MKTFYTLIFVFISFVYSSGQEKDIFYCARSGDAKTAEILLKSNSALVDSVNNQGYSPLVLACYYNRLEFVELLIRHNVKLNDQPGESTALQAASYKGFDEVVHLLLDYGADPDIYDANGTTPLIYASQFSHTEVVKLLLEYGADISYTDPNHLSALDYAKKLELTEIIQLLESSSE